MHLNKPSEKVPFVISEREVVRSPSDLPPPVHLKKPVDPQWIVDIIRAARDGAPNRRGRKRHHQ